MRAKAILLDFGGTLDGDGVHWSDRFFGAYRHAGIGVERGAFDRAFVHADRLIAVRDDMEKVTLGELLRLQVTLQMEALGVAAERADEVVTPLLRETRETLARNALILARLARHSRLGIVSNFSGNLATVCREAGIAALVDVLLDSRVEGVAKPDPALFSLALRRLGSSAADSTFVGDSLERDLAPAKALGMRTVWLAPAPVPVPATRSGLVDRRIASLVELEAALEARGV